jgi:hypothetical protein
LAPWRPTRHSSHLRGGGSRLPGVAGASELMAQWSSQRQFAGSAVRVLLLKQMRRRHGATI